MKWIKRQNFGVIALILVVILVFGHIVGATIGDNVREQQIAKVLKEFVLEEQKIETKYWDLMYDEEFEEKILYSEEESYNPRKEAESALKKYTTDNCSFFAMDDLISYSELNNLIIDASKYDVERISTKEINVYMELNCENKEYNYIMTQRYLYAEMIKVDGTWAIKYFKFSSQGRDSGLIW